MKMNMKIMLNNQLPQDELTSSNIDANDASLLKAAQTYTQSGLSVIPVRIDKTPAVSWTEYQSRIASDAELQQWFNGRSTPFGIVCGQVSGNVEVIDFDEIHNIDKDRSLFGRWKQEVDGQLPGIVDRLVLETSVRNGYHVYYKCSTVDGNKKLAQRPATEQEQQQDPDVKALTLIETRGEGGYCISAPNPGYRLLKGSFKDIPTITPEERDILLNCARSFNSYLGSSETITGIAKTARSGKTPGDAFNDRGDVQSVLLAAGWTLAYSKGDTQHWRRPGKAAGISATFNHVPNTFYVFSSNASPFENGSGYSRFAVYAFLKHDGNFSAAAKELAKQGYGDPHLPVTMESSTMVLAEEYLKESYNFRLNVITQKVEFCRVNSANYSVMTDTELNSFYRELHHAGIQIGIDQLSRLLRSDFSAMHDPFAAYVAGLNPWDQQTDFIQQLADSVMLKDQNEAKLFAGALQRWLIAAIACATERSVQNQHALILVGEQGKMKTTWLNGLVPKPLSEYKFVGTINPDNKDTLVYLSECFLINLDELETLRKADVGSLKSLMTLDKIKVRRPYDRESSTMDRRASFVGSINHGEFLNDPTGSRRFLVFEIDSINMKHGVNMDRVYAQAYHLYKTGVRYWFDQAEVQLINERNRDYEILSTEEELINRVFEVADFTDPDAKRFTSTSVAATISKLEQGMNLTSNSAQRFGSALTKAGFKSKRVGGKKLYAVKLKNPSSISFEEKSAIDRMAE